MIAPIRKTGLLLGTAFLILLGLCGFAFYNLDQAKDMTQCVIRSNLVMDQLDNLNTSLWSIESAVRGFSITGQPDFLQRYEPALQQVHGAYQELSILLRNDPAQARVLAELKQALDAKLAWQQTILQLCREQGVGPAEAKIGTGQGKTLMERIQDRITVLKVAEEGILSVKQSEQQTRSERTYQAMVLLSGLSGIILLLAYDRIVRYDRQRRLAEETRQNAILECIQLKTKALEKTEELDQFFNLSLDLMCITDLKGTFQRLNIAWKTVFDYSLEKLQGQPFLNFVHPEDLGPTQQVMNDLYEGKKTVNFINRFRCRDGTYRWIEWQSAPYRNRKVFSTARDVTASRKADLLRAAGEERYHQQFELTLEGILVLDYETGRIIDVNPRLLDMLGLQRTDLIGQDLKVLEGFSDPARGPQPVPEGKPAGQLRYEQAGSWSCYGGLPDYLELRQMGLVRYEAPSLCTPSSQPLTVEINSQARSLGGAKVIQCTFRPAPPHAT